VTRKHRKCVRACHGAFLLLRGVMAFGGDRFVHKTFHWLRMVGAGVEESIHLFMYVCYETLVMVNSQSD